MTWLTWRQHRWEALIAIIAAASLVALFFANVGPTEEYIRQVHSSANTCPGHVSGCFSSRPSYYEMAQAVWAALYVIPALIGIFVGAPLVAREYERGTHRLIWAQGVSRRRWLAVKIGLASVATLLITGPVAGVASVDLLIGVNGKVWSLWDHFDGSLVLVGHAIFALALGVAVGAFVRRAVPAMAITLGLFVAVRFAVAAFLRPYFLPPVVLMRRLGDAIPSDREFDWKVRTVTVDAHGHAPSLDPAGHLSESVREHIFYQPADRFWLFQSLETLIFLGLALALIGLSLWWVRRRPA